MSDLLGSVAEDVAPGCPGAERRASVRHLSTIWAFYHPLGAVNDAPRPARVRDVSTLGVGLVLPRPVALGALLRLDFAGAAGGVVCAALGRVVHAAADASRIVGCSFVRELDEAILQHFRVARVGSAAGDGRRWVRFPCNVETACYVLDSAPGEQSPARIVNISAGGMGLLLPCEFPAGTLLRLDLDGTAAHAAGEVLLRVIRVAGRDDGDWFMGCEFADQIGQEELERLL
jgi:hypothetical protein